MGTGAGARSPGSSAPRSHARPGMLSPVLPIAPRWTNLVIALVAIGGLAVAVVPIGGPGPGSTAENPGPVRDAGGSRAGPRSAWRPCERAGP